MKQIGIPRAPANWELLVNGLFAVICALRFMENGNLWSLLAAVFAAQTVLWLWIIQMRVKLWLTVLRMQDNAFKEILKSRE